VLAINEQQVAALSRNNAETIEIDIDKYEGRIPSGYMLVEYNRGDNPLNGCLLYGFDEVGIGFPNPAWAFIRMS